MKKFTLELDPETIDTSPGNVAMNVELTSEHMMTLFMPQALWETYDCPTHIIIEIEVL